SESKVLRIPFAHLITISGFEEDTANSQDAPALLHFDRRLRLFRLRRLHFLSSSGVGGDDQQRAERNYAPVCFLHVQVYKSEKSEVEAVKTTPGECGCSIGRGGRGAMPRDQSPAGGMIQKRRSTRI